MADSFFGFDTSVPLDDDGGGGRIAEPSEEEYDALNDETFGSAINGDWEEAHENLVRLTDNFNCMNGGDSDAGGVCNYGDKLPASSGESTPAFINSRLRQADPNADSDLEINLSTMKLDDVDLSYDDNDSTGGNIGGGITLDPSVWASHPIPPNQTPSLEALRRPNTFFENCSNNRNENGLMPNPADFLREHFPAPFQQEPQRQQHNILKHDVNLDGNASLRLPTFPTSNGGIGPKICTLEDIERNLIIQQTMQKQQQQSHQQQHQLQQQMPQTSFQQDTQQQPQQQQYINDILKHPPKVLTPIHQQQQQPNLQKQLPLQQKGPPGFPTGQVPARPLNNYGSNLAQQHPLGNFIQPHPAAASGNRLPPGFSFYSPGLAPHIPQQGHPQLPPHPLLNQHGLPSNFPLQHQRPLPNPHLPIALNNFAMHPNFNAMRAAAAAAGIHLVPPSPQPPRLPTHPANSTAIVNHQQPNSMYNMFNMRLVQEIQQNHPLLQNNARQQNNAGPFHQQQRSTGCKQNLHRRDGATGNLPPEEFDEYANLMSTRDKHWLIGIQLTQLNTDTPYIDDYYYTVYKERKATLSGKIQHSQAHKDNQLNHPLTQPKGHAQLILVQLGNKNGTRNGQHRESRNSESNGNLNSGQEQKPYLYTPLKFENSLGKLQYGSVTAPRKIIDAEIMGNDVNSTNESSTSTNKASGTQSDVQSSNTQMPLSYTLSGMVGDLSSTQRKSCHILLHIETMYRFVLKLEDLDNPNAIAAIIMKKKKERERIAALEQLENANKTPEERAVESSSGQSINAALKNKFAYEIETKDALISKLAAGLSNDKVAAMMTIRKGKTLIRRVMPYIDTNNIRWSVWIVVFSSLQNIVKKDREDSDGVLYSLYPEFKKQIKHADFEIIVKISSCLTLNDKKVNGVFCSRFGISSLVCLILRAEEIYVADCDSTLSEVHRGAWRQFLNKVAMSLNQTIQNQTICAAIESDSIQPMMNHFGRFKDLKLDSLLALITEAKQQIN